MQSSNERKMKKILLSFFAVTASAVSIKAETPSSFKHQFSLGVESMRYFYKEPNIYQDELVPRHGAVWMSDTGNLFGMNVSYRLIWKDILFIQPEGRIVKGTNAYRTGRKKTIVGKTKNKISVLLYEPRLIAGGHIPIVNKLTVSPYTGIGYRFKSDDSEDVKYIDLRPNVRRIDNDVLGYYRKSNYVYIPFGASADYHINDTWSLSLTGEYDWIVKAWHYNRGPYGEPSPPAVFKQPNGYGLKSEASISYLYNKVKFSVSPYLNYWNVRNSKYVDGAREPYNVTFESGLRLGVTF
jgi:hypothetical protein